MESEGEMLILAEEATEMGRKREIETDLEAKKVRNGGILVFETVNIELGRQSSVSKMRMKKQASR